MVRVGVNGDELIPLPFNEDMVTGEAQRAEKRGLSPQWPPTYSGAYHGLGFAPSHPGPGIACSKRGCNYALGHKTEHEAA